MLGLFNARCLPGRRVPNIHAAHETSLAFDIPLKKL
jgi:hypothetical protein